MRDIPNSTIEAEQLSANKTKLGGILQYYDGIDEHYTHYNNKFKDRQEQTLSA